MPTLVRGLDYYTRTTFEFMAEALGAQLSFAGGGRYDYLIEEIGGPPTPAVGIASGIERLVLSLEQQGVEPSRRRSTSSSRSRTTASRPDVLAAIAELRREAGRRTSTTRAAR